MTNKMKLLMALCDALGFDVVCTNEDYKLTKKVSALDEELDAAHTKQRKRNLSMSLYSEYLTGKITREEYAEKMAELYS